MKPHWDIFCRVIDNLGDIGVCLRLSRQLVTEHACRVRLWVDDLAALQLFVPALDTTLEDQVAGGIDIRHWHAASPIDEIADVVIEAFACALPEEYLNRMAARHPMPRWVNLEYLSAESWVDECHGLASPHPRLPLTKHFFFPGFTKASGGLLREPGILAGSNPDAAGSLAADGLTISLFCYPSAPWLPFLECLARHPLPVRCLVPPGEVRDGLTRHFDHALPCQIGSLRIEALPFLSQDDYDQLLRRCDLNFVRGEDSFLRAQWAGKPFVWQIYRQADDAHLVKLEAFLDRYGKTLQGPAKPAMERMFRAWNGLGDAQAAWPAFAAERQALGRHTRAWTAELATREDLASALVRFCASTV